MSEQRLHVPPEACPNDGVCMSIQPTLDAHEEQLSRHDKALGRIGTDLDQVKKDVHEIRITLREKDQMMHFLRTVFLALLAVFFSGVIAVIGQIGVTVWWAGQLNTTITLNQHSISDHESRIRSEEMESAARKSRDYRNNQP